MKNDPDSVFHKIESIGTLAGGIAHDFNNILTAILGYTEISMVESLPNTRIHDRLGMVLEAGNRAKRLVQQILTFSRRANTNSEVLEPAVIVRETLEMIRPTFPVTIEIKLDIDPGISRIYADPTQINQILMNLCTNANHAMEETGGVLGVSLNEKYCSEEELIHEEGIAAGDFIKFSVSDTGLGISEEMKTGFLTPILQPRSWVKVPVWGLRLFTVL